MKPTFTVIALILISAASSLAQDQTPAIFGDPSLVVVGAQKIETLYTWAEGKWSDADEKLGPVSAVINCYKRFGFCEEAEAGFVLGSATVNLGELDILRWDDSELIAVDSSPICVVNTIRFDFHTKQVTFTVTPKAVTKDMPQLSKQMCASVKPTTAFLSGGTKLK